MQHAGEIVVGVDGSEGAADALRWAEREAAVRGSSLVALMTWGYLDQHHPDGTQFVAGYDESDAAAALDVFVRSALGDSAPAVQRRLRNDLAVPALLEAGAGAELLVLGARGRGGFGGLLLGSVSQTCIHHAPCPVAIVRGQPDRSTPAAASADRVVVGVDGSPGSRAALDWALDECRRRGARLQAVHAWAWPVMAGYPLDIEFDPEMCRATATKLLDDELDRAGGGESAIESVQIERSVVDRHPAEAIIDATAGAALAVVGTRGIGGFRAMLLGAVSHQVAQHAACPVVVVPSPA